MDVGKQFTMPLSDSDGVLPRLRTAFITGLAVLIPTVISLYVLMFIWGFIAQFITPVTDIVQALGVTSEMSLFFVQAVSLIVLVMLILALGVAAQHNQGQRIVDSLDLLFQRIPGIGTLYKSARKMSDMLLDGEGPQFKEVKLVEFPSEGIYVLGFVTADTPDMVTDATPEDELITMFLPLAPNPVMGGNLVYVPKDRVHDTDISMDQAFQALVTSGMATSKDADVDEFVVRDADGDKTPAVLDDS